MINWTEIECDIDSDNLKKYLRAKFQTLNYFDINNIIRIIVKNQLPFNVADKMSSLLYKMKTERSNQLSDSTYDANDESYFEPQRRNVHSDERSQTVNGYTLTLKKAEIAAAANIACAYLGIQKEIEFDKDILNSEILKYQDELTNF